MLDLLDSNVVRRGFDRDGQTVWLNGGQRMTAAQARVITLLQVKKLVTIVSAQVQITGWVGTRTVSRLVRK